MKQSHCIQSIGPLVQASSTQIKILSKVLIARLIPSDVVSDDAAVLILVEDDEVNDLISCIETAQSYKRSLIPVISVMLDLGRSPHNLFALASKDTTVNLSNIMESCGEDDQARSAQLIWRIMELEYDESVEVSAITNNGSLKVQYGGTI